MLRFHPLLGSSIALSPSLACAWPLEVSIFVLIALIFKAARMILKNKGRYCRCKNFLATSADRAGPFNKGILPAAGFFCLSFCGENQVDNSLVVADTEFFRWINAVKWSPRRTTQNSILKVAIETGYIEHAAFTKGKLKCLRGAPRGMF